MNPPTPETCEQCSRVIYLEQEARRAHERIRTIIEYATCGVVMLDEGARILYVNRYVSEALGYDLSELENRSVFDFVHPNETRLRRMLFEKTLTQPGQLRDRGYARLKSKAGIWILLGIRVLNLLHDANVGVIIAYATDESAQMGRYYGNSNG